MGCIFLETCVILPQFEQVNSFKYLGKMANTDNSIEEEIKERIAAGNREYLVHKNYFHQN